MLNPRTQWDDRWVFLVMEYCGGGDLDRYLRQYGPLAEPLALACMQQLGTWRGGSLDHGRAWAGS